MEDDKSIGSQCYESTSAGVEVFIKEERLMPEDPDFEEYENYSKPVGGTSSITKELSGVGTMATPIKEECVQDTYDDERMLSHIGEQCETVNAADHHFILQPSGNKSQEEFILPDKIDNFHAIEKVVKKEPVSCEITTEAPRETSLEVNCGPISLKEELGIFSTNAADQDPHPRKCKDYKLGNISEEYTSEYLTTTQPMLPASTLSEPVTPALQHQCKICDRNFSYPGYLKMHMRFHMGESPYKCDVCANYFRLKEDLEQHVNSHKHAHQCETCKMVFTDDSTLKLHEIEHTRDKPYPCSICEKGFTKKQNLVVHMRSHTGEKPYPCTVCKKRFSKKENMVVHLRTHKGEKPFPCTVCKKSFGYIKSLDGHMRSHTGEKPYPCTVCKKCFSSRQNLLQHMPTHTGLKPYMCTACKKHFVRKEQLVRHKCANAEGKPCS